MQQTAATVFTLTVTGHQGGTCTKVVAADDPDGWSCGWLYGDEDACEGEYHYETEDCACLDGEVYFDCYGNDGETYAGTDYESDNDCKRVTINNVLTCQCNVTVTKWEPKDVTDCAECPNGS